MKKSGVLFFCLIALHICGQDHYWSQQYGGQATLMGGTAVVGSNDNSPLYYNPGAIGFIDSARVTATTFAIGFEYAVLKNGAGDGLDLKSNRINVLPQLVAGSIVIKKVPKLKLILGTFTRSRTNLKFDIENEGPYEIINGSPGSEYYRARMEFVNNSVEQWAGLGLAYKFNRTWSAGVSMFCAYSHIEMKSEQNISAEAVSNGVPYTTSANESNASYINQVMQIFKVGLAARFKHLQLGLALTAPGIKLWGQGRLDKSLEVYNLDQNALDTSVPALKYSSYTISDVQRGLKSHFKVPLSVSVGVKVVYPKFSISASAEYFLGSKKHSILKGIDRAVVRPAAIFGNTPVLGFMDLSTSVFPVINAGLGAEITLKPKIHYLVGARTDFSNRTEYLPGNSAINVLSTKSPSWDFVYFSTGFTYKPSLHSLTLGLDYGYGFARSREQMYNLTEPGQSTLLRGTLNPVMKTSVHKLDFILSYTYFFKPREKKYGPLSMIPELEKLGKEMKRKAHRRKKSK